MKNQLLVLFALLFLSISCDQKNCCVPPPVESEFHGTWELVKVISGFSGTEIPKDQIGYNEKLIFNATAGTLSQIRNENEVLFSQFEIGIESNQGAVILPKEQTYQWYTFFQKEDKTILSLYQKSDIGAVIADGNYFEYQKVQ
jgi:hypothetical protein